MIFVKNNVFHLNTAQSSYIFRVTEQGDLEHLYYGRKIKFQENYDAFFQKNSLLLVSTLYPKTDVTYGIDKMCTDRYKEIRSILNGASFYRLSDGFSENFNSWFLVDKSRKTAYLYVF
uniref:hypothetical protein n=1 Tax=Eubacterium sp. TaxID=142586 RepID=UPI003FEFA916